jgi:hypothetical protein
MFLEINLGQCITLIGSFLVITWLSVNLFKVYKNK